ncbi:SPARC-related modular calcium-binding protein 1 [Liparis tanakae]|uniref:SPARC-related modular calcium-binding protein 1 n=1 Tax=Liparis tanakae TaxID=230148 RepID=A0A4Z2H097_9TELE|nr:SPARC-related modular calcium-binding protein 1 [Liparis tanakae]
MRLMRLEDGKPVCGSDGRSYETGCELQRARCRDKALTLAHRGRCRGKNWVKTDQLPAAPAPTATSETRDLELKGEAATHRVNSIYRTANME